MVLRGVDGDAQRAGDLGVGVALGDEMQYLALAVAQIGSSVVGHIPSRCILLGCIPLS